MQTQDQAADLDIDLDGEAPPLIPAGAYEAVGGRGGVFAVFRGWKLSIPFEVVLRDSDAASGTRTVVLNRYYNVVKVGTQGKRRFKVGRFSDYSREWSLVAGRRMSRTDRPHVGVFEGTLVRVKVDTVTHDRHQRPLPEHARYSKVAAILECLAGGVRP